MLNFRYGSTCTFSSRIRRDPKKMDPLFLGVSYALPGGYEHEGNISALMGYLEKNIT